MSIGAICVYCLCLSTCDNQRIRNEESIMMDIIDSNIEDYLKKLSKFDLYATQFSSGKFFSCQRDLQLPKLIIGSWYVRTSILYQGVLKEDYFYIVIPRRDVSVLINGQKTEFNQPLVFTIEQEMLVCRPDNSYNLYISIPTVELAKYFDEEYIAQLKNATRQQNLGKQVFVKYEKNQNHLCSLIEVLLKKSKTLSYQVVLDSQETIIELLCKLLTLISPLPRQNNISQIRRLAIVNRALNHIHNGSIINVTSPYLAEVSFCSLRNLEYAFKSLLNITPKQYLIKRRMQLIHSALKSDRKVLISEIINNFGIVNQGRFAKDYLKFYNEYPHQTRDKYLDCKV
jgi:AraC family ethanolamine operon transcriptional activator